MVTIWACLSQVVCGKFSACGDAVARVIADRSARGKKACSTDSSSFCTARSRLPEQVLVDLTQEIGQELHRQAPPNWLWKERSVALVDGSTATMDDTETNQAEYPQSKNQKKGLGFPILRLVVLLSLSVGTVLECAMGACRGKKTGEQSLFRQMGASLQAGDIVLGDRLYDCYRDIICLKARGIDVVFGMKQSRQRDFRRGQRLGPGDHVVTWKKPRYDASRYESRTEWESLPEEMEMREVSITVRRPGHRTRTIAVVTTLLDAEQDLGQGPDGSLFRKVALRTGPAFDQASVGHAPSQQSHPADGSQGVVAALVGVQSGSRADGAGGQLARANATSSEFHRRQEADSQLRALFEYQHRQGACSTGNGNVGCDCPLHPGSSPRSSGTAGGQKTRTKVFILNETKTETCSHQTTCVLISCH